LSQYIRDADIRRALRRQVKPCFPIPEKSHDEKSYFLPGKVAEEMSVGLWRIDETAM
jgi:hypothetical protein